jgi:hypothetical protein
MKDVDYTMKLMSTAYGSTLPTETASNRWCQESYEDANGNKATKEFKYTETTMSEGNTAQEQEGTTVEGISAKEGNR